MYASFLNLPEAGRHSRALHLKLFTAPSVLTTFYEFVTVNYPRFLEVIEMAKTNEELYQGRAKRLVDAIQLRQPDRVRFPLISLTFRRSALMPSPETPFMTSRNGGSE